MVLILMLGIGIGASTTVFTALYSVVLQPLPVKEIDRLVVFNAPGPRGQDALGYWSQLRTLEMLCSYESGGVTESEGVFPTRISATVVSASFFTVIETLPKIGRQFEPADEESGPSNLAIISHHFWIERYASDPSVVGRSVALEGISHTIVGVMPAGFRYPGRTDVWVLSRGASRLSLGQGHFDLPGLMGWAMLGRLRETATLAQCQAEADGLFSRLKETGSNPGNGVRVLTLRHLLVRDYRSAFFSLFAAAGSLLLIAVVNASNIQLTRAVARQKDTSIRVCLGASPKHIIRLFLAEAFVTAIMGGATGVLLAHWGVALVRLLGQKYIPSLSDLGVNSRALGFALLASTLAALAIQVIPVLRALSKDPLEALRKRSGRSTVGFRRFTRDATAVVEVAVALVLMVTAALTTQTVFRLTDVASGMDSNGMVSMSIELPQPKYGVSLELKRSPHHHEIISSATDSPEASAHPLEEFQHKLTEGISRLPGVSAVGVVSQLPLSSSIGRRQSVSTPGSNATFALIYHISGEYFHTMRIPMMRGRDFNRSDTKFGQKAVIVNQYLATLYWPNSDAVGQRLTLGDESESREVVGVVGDVLQVGLVKPAEPQFYVPYMQPYRGKFPVLLMSLVARIDGDPKALLPSIQALIVSLDKNLAVFRVRTMREVVAESISAYTFRANLLALFASLGLLMAVFGVFGVIAFMVRTRTHEIGIRISLGARPGQIITMVLRRGALLAFFGVVVGTGAATALTRLISSLLYGVQPLDTRTLIGSAVVVFGTALLACLAPALFASRVDPVRALRHE